MHPMYSILLFSALTYACKTTHVSATSSESAQYQRAPIKVTMPIAVMVRSADELAAKIKAEQAYNDAGKALRKEASQLENLYSVWRTTEREDLKNRALVDLDHAASRLAMVLEAVAPAYGGPLPQKQLLKLDLLAKAQGQGSQAATAFLELVSKHSQLVEHNVQP